MSTLLLIVQLMSVLPSLIQNVESLFAGKPKSGAEKKAIVTQTIRAMAVTAGQVGVKDLRDMAKVNAIVETAGALTDAIVAGVNAAGVFSKSNDPQS